MLSTIIAWLEAPTPRWVALVAAYLGWRLLKGFFLKEDLVRLELDDHKATLKELWGDVTKRGDRLEGRIELLDQKTNVITDQVDGLTEDRIDRLEARIDHVDEDRIDSLESRISDLEIRETGNDKF